MWDAGPQQLADWIDAHWQVAAWLAAALAGATGAAMATLPRDLRENVSLWMMGAASHQTWATSFTALLDALFGRRHLGLRCLAVSTLVSLITVVTLWISLGTLDGQRLTGIDAFWKVIALGLLVNALADYVSLLETRMLLGWLARPRPLWLQALVLVADLVITAAIIWAALWVAQASGLTGFVMGDERYGLAEVVGLFSPLAVFFYSTFVTSIWTWGIILSSWLMRMLAHLRVFHTVYVEHPIKALSTALGTTAFVVGFLGSTAFGALTAPDTQNLSVVDRALCRVAGGNVCLHVRSLTEDEVTRLVLTLDACRGGIFGECMSSAFDTNEINGAIAARYWHAACDAGNAQDCTNLEVLHHHGIGMEPDLTEAARLYRQGCDDGDAQGCSFLGFLHQNGIGMEPDLAEAARLYRQGCDGGYAIGCTNLAFIHSNGGMEPDPAEAARLFRQGCDGGDAYGCTNLGFLRELGIGVERDLADATRLFRQGCDGGDEDGCDSVDRVTE